MVIIGFGYCCTRRAYGRAEHPAPRLTFKSPFVGIARPATIPAAEKPQMAPLF